MRPSESKIKRPVCIILGAPGVGKVTQGQQILGNPAALLSEPESVNHHVLPF